jgi:TetR/AcrR family transcriptional repressor of nem operon
MDIELSPTAAQIVGTACNLLVSGGYNSFSYADIARHVQITKASIHHHFPSKANLVQTVVQLHREKSRNGLMALTAKFDDPLVELRAYTEHWSACILDRSPSFCICAMLAPEIPSIPSEVAQEVHGFFEDLTAWLAYVLERGAAKRQFELERTPSEEAKSFVAIVYGAMLGARAYADPGAFGAIVSPAIDRLKRKTSRAK